MDLEKMDVNKKVDDKIGLGYMKFLSLFVFTGIRSPKKWGQTQKSEIRSDNMKSAKDNRRK
jgi:hypothetical protein